MDPHQDNETFAVLEDKIERAVALVHLLREENAGLTSQLKALASAAGGAAKQKEEFDAALTRAHRQAEQAKSEAEQARGEVKRLQKDVDQLQSERKQVRTRIEKVLTQIDQLAGQ